MITESGIQPLLALIFATGGAIAYLPMIIIGWLPMGERLPVLKHILEGVWGLLFCVAFIAITHFVYEGRTKYFTVLSFLAGAGAASIFLRLPVEKLARALHRKYLHKIDERRKTENPSAAKEKT